MPLGARLTRGPLIYGFTGCPRGVFLDSSHGVHPPVVKGLEMASRGSVRGNARRQSVGGVRVGSCGSHGAMVRLVKTPVGGAAVDLNSSRNDVIYPFNKS